MGNQGDAVLCFKNQIIQVLHKYAAFVSILLVGAVSWFLIGLDKRVTVGAELNAALRVEVRAQEESRKATVEQLVLIQKKLSVIDHRLYILITGKASQYEWP